MFPEILWVVQVRGGPDLIYHETGSSRERLVINVLSNADKIICDSETNYELALKLNASKEKFFGMVISGTGGMDIQGFRSNLVVNSNNNKKLVVWPKAYETISSKALPVLEGIKIAWEQIKHCEFRFLWVTQEEITVWIQNNYSAELRNSIKIFPRVSRAESIKHISDADILLSPSLMDGIPNTLLEAMTLDTIPIVSPLESIMSLVNEPGNVYFARNLYPTEIAQALIASLSDPAGNLVRIQNNLSIIKEKYDREIIKDKVINFYENLF
jgi:glycosyltransferase involved in cell wall biosynthesis